MATQLTNLEAKEVSLVNRGANKKKFLVFKNLKGEGKMQKELQEMISKADPKTLESLEKILKEYGDQMQKDGLQLDPRVEAAIKAVVRILTPFKEQISPVLLHEALHVAGIQLEAPEGSDEEEASESDEEEAAEGDAKEGSAADDAEEEDEEEDSEDDAGKKLPFGKEVSDEHHKEADKAGKQAYEGAYKAHVEKLGYKMYPDAVEKSIDDKEEEVSTKEIMKADGTINMEAVSPEMKPLVEAIYKSHQDVVKKNEQLETELKAEREIRLTREFAAKAKVFKNLGAKEEDLAAVLKSLNEKDKDLAGKIEAILKAADAQVAKGELFSEFGSEQPANNTMTWERIEQAAMGAVAKSGDKVSKEEAVSKFLETKEGQSMYGEYKAARKGGI